MNIDREIIYQSWLLCDCFYMQMSQLPHSAMVMMKKKDGDDDGNHFDDDDGTDGDGKY